SSRRAACRAWRAGRARPRRRRRGRRSTRRPRARRRPRWLRGSAPPRGRAWSSRRRSSRSAAAGAGRSSPRAYRRSVVALTHVLLFCHLLGAVCFFAGAAVVGTLQHAAIRRERPSEIHAFLRLAPVGAGLVGLGALLTVVFGIALAEHEGFGFSPAWIRAALGLWLASMAVGAYGGRTARRARRLAARLAAEGDAPSPEL